MVGVSKIAGVFYVSSSMADCITKTTKRQRNLIPPTPFELGIANCQQQHSRLSHTSQTRAIASVGLFDPHSSSSSSSFFFIMNFLSALGSLVRVVEVITES